MGQNRCSDILRKDYCISSNISSVTMKSILRYSVLCCVLPLGVISSSFYDRDLPPPDSSVLSRSCAQLWEEVNERIRVSPELVGAFVPDCLEDGSWSPVQCRGSMCYCVDGAGTDLGYMVPRWQIGNMNCGCALDEADYNDVGEILECTANGNYAPRQCKNSKCFCVDEFGEIDPSTRVVPVTEYDSLL